MAGVEENYRSRIAITIGVIGVILILLGVALIVQHIEQTSVLQPNAKTAPQKNIDPRMIQGILFLTLILVGIFAVASLAFLRWSKRFRVWMFHKPPPATPSEDVWVMHRLPENDPELPDTDIDPEEDNDDFGPKPE